MLVHVGLDPVQAASTPDAHHDNKMNNVVTTIFTIFSFVLVELSMMMKCPLIERVWNPVDEHSTKIAHSQFVDRAHSKIQLSFYRGMNCPCIHFGTGDETEEP